MGIKERLRKQPDSEAVITLELPVEQAAAELSPAPTARGPAPDNKTYYLISRKDESKLLELIATLKKVPKFSFDFETSTEDPVAEINITEQNFIVGISFSWEKGLACYLPIRHDNYSENWDVSVLLRFKDIFENPDVLKIAHNIKFEDHWLQKLGIVMMGRRFDPMLALNAMKLRYEHIGLKPVVKQVFDYDMLTYDDVTGFVEEWDGTYYKSGPNKGQKKMKQRQRKFNEVPVNERCLEYTCADSDWAFRLEGVVTDELIKDGLYELVTEIDVPLTQVLVQIERNGWHTSRDRFKELQVIANAKIAELEVAIYKEIRRQLRLAPEAEVISPTNNSPFNINSGQHLAWLLFEELKLPVQNRSEKTNAPSTDAESLEKLQKMFPSIPLFNLIMDYKKYKKIESTYLRGYYECLRNDDRLHSKIDAVFVSTGRFSSSNPNLQNAPRLDNDPMGIRSLFIAPGSKASITGKDSLYMMCD